MTRARKIQRFLSQPFHDAEVFTGSPGKYVPLKDSILGFKAILAGEYDQLAEQAFYMVGGMEAALRDKVGAKEIAEAQAELARAAAQLRAIEKLRQIRKSS